MDADSTGHSRATVNFRWHDADATAQLRLPPAAVDADATAQLPRVTDRAEAAPGTAAAPASAAGGGDGGGPGTPDIDEWEPGRPDTPAQHRRKRNKWLTALVVAGVLILVCSGVGTALALGLLNRYDDKVNREDILGDVPKAAPDGRWDHGPLNFLVLGSDSRADAAAPIDDPDGSRSDTIMVVHINADHNGAFIFSIPRDSYVNVPAGGNWKGGKNKINAAFAFGGAKLAAKTVYELTGIPLDGAMIVNFGGIHTMVGEVGTVRVCIPYSVRSIHTDRYWAAGCHDMGPEETEDFMRQRMSVPGGDFGRIHDQQLVVKALADKISEEGLVQNPLRLDRLVSTAAESVTVDKDTNLRDLIVALKDIKPENIKFATTPYTGTFTSPAGSSVQLDDAKAKQLFQAVKDDKTNEWLAANPQKDPSSPN